jgi:hypothetical protein
MSENGSVLDFFGVSTSLLFGLGLLTLGIKVWALVDSVTRPGPAYPAAGKLTKPVWVGILAAAVLLGGINVFGCSTCSGPSPPSSTWSTCAPPCGSCAARRSLGLSRHQPASRLSGPAALSRGTAGAPLAARRAASS